VQRSSGVILVMLALTCVDDPTQVRVTTPTPRPSALEAPEIAQVDGVDISRDSFDEACRRLLVTAAALQDAVDSLLVDRAALAADIVVDDELPPAERRRAQLEQLAPWFTAETLPEEAVRAYYEGYRHQFDAPERFFVEFEEKYFVVTEAEDGGEIVEALRKLAPGERSEPLPYQGELLELRLVAYDPEIHVSYDEARFGIAESLAKAVTDAHQAEALTVLRQSAEITYSEAAQCEQ
jgi:hypothetical protein